MEDLSFTTQTSFLHHGIEGQKWGVRNGPPYPLDRIASFLTSPETRPLRRILSAVAAAGIVAKVKSKKALAALGITAGGLAIASFIFKSAYIEKHRYDGFTANSFTPPDFNPGQYLYDLVDENRDVIL